MGEEPASSLDPLGIRGDFPATSLGAYLNSAYITPTPTPVMEVGRAFVEAKAGWPHSLEEMLAETDRTRESVADLIGAKPHEVGFVSSTSEVENIVAAALDLKAGDNVVVGELHYNTTLLLYSRLRDRLGIEFRVAPSVDGRVDPEAIEARIDDRTRIVSVAWVAHQNGFRHDLKRLGAAAHAHDALLYVDAIQGLGTLALDVREADIDVLGAGAFKWLLGGFGTAMMFVREEWLERIPPDRFGAMHLTTGTVPDDFAFELVTGAAQYEYATLAYASVYQLRAGVEYLKRVGVPRIEGHAVGLARQVWDGVAAQGFRMITPPEPRSTLVAFEHGRDPASALADLEAARVRVTFRQENRHIRVSTALFNNAADVDALLAATARWAS